MEKDDSKANRLIHETSPYLLQHAYNPVDWFPWCEEAFEKAKAEDKPILLSCGYSSCHWCHVMEKESFENIEIASLMNQNFISVKVDREERPDIDQLYQHAIQMIAGGGGWPLTVFLDHERKPFYGGTYFPPVPMYGQSGFPHILRTIAGKWHNKRMDITKDSAEIFRSLQSIVEKPSFSSLSEQDLPEIAAHELFTEIDEKNGGFGSEPKFPNPVLLQLLLSNGTTDNQTSFLEHVKFTLEQMSRGGIYDQLGGGFHRYSTDRYWLVPHFEKMLCDNAQLIKLYTVGYQLTKADMFKRVVTETSDYIRREMTDPQGGFYSTQDADSEGVEGKYYIWDIQEIRSALDPDETQLFIDYYGISEEGNFEGCNILNRIQQSDKVIEPGLISKLTNAKQRLLSIRNDRVKPFRDEKIITSWNGLMIGALACSYQVFNREEDYQSACRAAEFVLKSVRLSNGNLARTYKDGQAKIEGMLDDYSFLVRGLIDLYETDMNEVWLQKSLHFTEAANKQFAAGIGHYYMSKYTEELAVKPLSGQDEATPSGVAVHCENLLRLAAFTGNLDFYREAEKILMAYSLQIEEDNWGHAGLIDCLNMYYKGFSQFVFISTEEEIPEMLLNLRKNYIPYRILAWGNNISKNSTTHPAGGLFQKRGAIQGKPTCYACFQKSCFPAVSSWEELKNIVYKKGLSLL